MSRTTRYEYLEKMCERYRRYRGKPARSKLITEFCEVTGHERKYANKLLANKRGPSSRGQAKKRGVGRTYGEDVVDVIFEIWKRGEPPCGKRLRPMLAIWLPYYERHHGELAAPTRERVLGISAAQRRSTACSRCGK